MQTEIETKEERIDRLEKGLRSLAERHESAMNWLLGLWIASGLTLLYLGKTLWNR
jgi:hypothetical protein